MAKRKPFIAGNWKMNLDKDGAIKLIDELSSAKIDYKTRDVLVAPSAILIDPVICKINVNKAPIKVACQNIYYEDKGAFTGEVSVNMVKSTGAKYVLIGHSERRSIFKECDTVVNKKVLKALENKLEVIICVGESLWEREANAHIETVLAQVGKALHSVKSLSAVTIAYEPVWAIGTGKTATPKDAENMHKAIRDYIAKIRGKATAEKVRILYGGSVTPQNAKELLKQKNIDGALVGGASLKSEDFLKIINFDK